MFRIAVAVRSFCDENIGSVFWFGLRRTKEQGQDISTIRFSAEVRPCSTDYWGLSGLVSEGPRLQFAKRENMTYGRSSHTFANFLPSCLFGEHRWPRER